MKNKQVPILLVENDPAEVASTLRSFKAHGVENPFYLATNGRVALDMIQGRGMPALSPSPKIILLDVDLPEMCGLAFLKELRKDSVLRACSVFVITTQGSEKHIREAYDLNVAGYILKPLHDQSFQTVVETLHSFWNLIELPH